MIGIVLITHGRIGMELLSALEHIVGKQENIATIGIKPSDKVEEKRIEILETVNKVRGDGGVVLLTDMFGGTPSNLAISVMNERNVEVLAGANLPMLIQLARIRKETTLIEAVKEAKEAGQKNINLASELLAERNG